MESIEATKRRFVQASEDEVQGRVAELPSPVSPPLTPRGAGEASPVTIREAARRVERDVKAVHADVTGLLNAEVLVNTEVLDKTEDNKNRVSLIRRFMWILW